MGVRLDFPHQPRWMHRVDAKAARYLPFWSCGSKNRACPPLQPSTGAPHEAVGISGLLTGVGLLRTWLGQVTELSQPGSQVALGCWKK